MKVEVIKSQIPKLYIGQIQIGETFQLSETKKYLYLMIADNKSNGWKVLCLDDNKYYSLSEFKSLPLELIKTKVILDNS